MSMQENQDKRREDSGAQRASRQERFGLRGFLRRLVAVFSPVGEPVKHDVKPRVYPELPNAISHVTLPISFVVIRFSDEFLHNFIQSECVQGDLNEIIEVENTSNLYYDSLSLAILAGVEKAQNDIIAVIHEDVLLPPGWQSRFEQSLWQLEKYDANWGMLGSVGWDARGEFVGHWSDPHQFKNTFNDSQRCFQQAEKLDEQLLIFHRKRMPKLDSDMPGIHFLGEGLKHELSSSGMKSYAIDAPTIHKYADKNGEVIVRSTQSDKISDRESDTYLADEACCKDYINWKYPNLFTAFSQPEASLPSDAQRVLLTTSPIIFVCKGELEAKYIRRLAQANGVFMGGAHDGVDHSSMLMMPVYKMIVEKYRCHATWQKSNTLKTIAYSASQTIRDLPQNTPWGFVVPESILVLPELQQAFPSARYVYCQRDPLASCLEEPPKSARLDNHIGRIALPEAYTFLGLELAQILRDSDIDHSVYTTIHQLELVRQQLLDTLGEPPLILRFEDCLAKPDSTQELLLNWLGDSLLTPAIPAVFTDESFDVQVHRHSSEVISAAAHRLRDVRKALGYI